MALMKIDQAGLSAGVSGRARNDGLSDGSLVTLTDMTPGGSTLFELLWADPEDTTSVLSLAPTVDPHVWTFSPTEDVGVGYGFRIRLTHTTNIGVVTTQTRIFGIPDELGVVKPIPGERSDPNATIGNATDSATIARCERNWPTEKYPLGNPFGWGPELIELIEAATGGLTSPQRSAIQAGDLPTNLNPFLTRSHLAKLGTGAVTLQQFDWPGGGANIGPYLETAIAYALAHHIGTIELPNGVLVCDREIVLPPASDVGGFVSSILIRGQGREQTYVYFYNHTTGFRFAGANSSGGNYYIGGGLKDLQIVGVFDGGAPGNHHGVWLNEVIFTILDNVWIRGFNGYGLVLAVHDAASNQDLHFSNVQVQGNREGGIWCQNIGQSVWTNMQVNQNHGDGMVFNQVSGLAIVGGLFQNEGRAIRCTPRDEPGDDYDGQLAVNMTLYGAIYVEQPDSGDAIFDFEEPTGSSDICMLGSVVVQGGSLTTPVFRYEGNYGVMMAGKIHAAGWVKHIQAVNLAEFTGIGLATPTPTTTYDFDAYSAANATFIGRGALSVGHSEPAEHAAVFKSPLQLAAAATGSEGSVPGLRSNTTLIAPTFSLDGTNWYALAKASVWEELAPYLADYWDAAKTVHSAATITRLRGSVANSVLLPTAAPTYQEYTAALNDQPSIHCVKADGSYMAAAGLSLGLAGDRPYIITVFAHHVLSSGAEIQFASIFGNAAFDTSSLAIDANSGSADFVYGVGFHHVGGAGPTGSTPTGTTGHIVERYFGSGVGSDHSFFKVDGIGLAASDRSDLTIGPVTQVMWGSNAPLGGVQHADVDIAIEVYCRILPPLTLRNRVIAELKRRFGIA